MKKNGTTPRPRGRPRAFDRDEVLAKAAGAFWRLGYEGASLADLTAAMGITAQSLYSAFGSKAGLYRAALGWYGEGFAALAPEALASADAIGTLGRLLVGEARRFSDPAHPPGCMIATAVLGCAVENDAVARLVAAMREESIGRIHARLRRAKKEGELAASADPAALARFVGAIIQGMSVQARDGASRRDLLAIARLAAEELERHRA